MFVTACDIAFSTPRTLEDSINIRTIQCSRQTESCTETNTKHDHAYIFLNQLILCCLNSTINLRLNQSINQSIFICSKCPEIHIKDFSIASRTTRLRPALTAAQLINYTMKEKEKLNAYKIAYGGVHIHCTRFYMKLITVTKIR